MSKSKRKNSKGSATESETQATTTSNQSSSKDGKTSNQRNSSSKEVSKKESGVSESSERTDDKRYAAGSGHNDPRYYGSAEVVALATSWSWAHRIGNVIPTTINKDTADYVGGKYPSITGIVDDLLQDAVPGIMALRLIPTPGVSNSPQSPINIAAYDQYGFLRSKISGSRPYTKSDMMIEWMAVDTCYMMSLAMDRALGSANAYAQQNRYLAKDLVEAQGFDYDDLQANFANYITDFNLVKSRLNTLKIPAILPVVKRHAFMMSHIYKDDELESKAQLYVHVMHSGYEYDPANAAYYGLKKFDWITDETVIKTFREWLTKLKSLVANISSDAKFSQISGDIEKAYGTENCLAVAPSIAGSVVELEYDPEMLYQIHHAKLLGEIETSGTNPVQLGNIVVDVTDPYTHIVYEPYIKSDSVAADISRTMDYILDSASESPSADEGMTDTRLTPAIFSSADDQHMVLGACGSEIVMNASIYGYKQNTSFRFTWKENVINSIVGGAFGGTSFGRLSMYNCFKKAPIAYLIYASGANVNIERLPFCEMKVYTKVTNSELDVAHMTAVQNQFAIPVVSTSKM